HSGAEQSNPNRPVVPSRADPVELFAERLFLADCGNNTAWISVDGSKLRPPVEDHKLHMVRKRLGSGGADECHRSRTVRIDNIRTFNVRMGNVAVYVTAAVASVLPLPSKVCRPTPPKGPASGPPRIVPLFVYPKLPLREALEQLGSACVLRGMTKA